jgi:hypothetical protein
MQHGTGAFWCDRERTAFLDDVEWQPYSSDAGDDASSVAAAASAAACAYHTFTPREIGKCLRKNKLLLLGDSLTLMMNSLFECFADYGDGGIDAGDDSATPDAVPLPLFPRTFRLPRSIRTLGSADSVAAATKEKAELLLNVRKFDALEGGPDVVVVK